MDKEEFRVKLEEINRLVEEEDYRGAMDVVDQIDWRRVKNVRTLCVVGEIYAANKRYEDSKEIFLLAYHKAPIGKNILYRLIEISLKTGDLEDAHEYYEEYLEVAPNDNTKYILQYKIAKAEGQSKEKQIQILEKYKDSEFTEKWSYELAKLYYETGEEKKCTDLVDEMVVWFNEGKYVAKALDLKKKFGLLSESEEEKISKEKEEEENNGDVSSESEDPASEAAPVKIESISTKDNDIHISVSIQEKISRGIRDIFNGSNNQNKEEAEENDEEAIPGEIIRDINDPSEDQDVPALESEKFDQVIVEPKKDIKTLQDDIKDGNLPKLEIPDSMKKSEQDKKVEVPEAPVVTNVNLVELDEKQKDSFNLEDTILAAASAQGIEIPDEKQEEVKEEPEKQEELVQDDAESEEISETEEKQEEKETEKPFVEEIPTLEEEDFIKNDYYEEKIDDRLSKSMKSKEEDNKNSLKNSLLIDIPDDFSEESNEKSNLKEPEEEYLDDFSEEEEDQEDHTKDLIPRGKKLSDRERKLFTYLASVPGMEGQIVDALSDVQMAAADKTSRTGNIIVMGGRETGKTRLISGLIPAICDMLHLEATKVAYVFSDQINGKNVAKIVKKLSSGFLVIEEANKLESETVQNLNKAMEFRTDGLTVILEDEKIGMRKLIAKYPKFAQKFTSIINIPVFTIDELVYFASVYLTENGYQIDEDGMLALQKQIKDNQKADEPMNIGAVKELIDTAIEKSKRGIKKRKRNNEGFIPLTEKDFNIK